MMISTATLVASLLYGLASLAFFMDNEVVAAGYSAGLATAFFAVSRVFR